MERIELVKKWKDELIELEKDYERNASRSDYDIFSKIDELTSKMISEGATQDDLVLIGDVSLDKNIADYIDEEFSFASLKVDKFGDINDDMIYSDNSKDHKNGVIFIKVKNIDINYLDDIIRLIPNFKYTSQNYRTQRLGNIFWEEHDTDSHAKYRVDIFRKYKDIFYVSYWRNGQFLYSNDENESCSWNLK